MPEKWKFTTERAERGSAGVAEWRSLFVLLYNTTEAVRAGVNRLRSASCSPAAQPKLDGTDEWVGHLPIAF